MAFRKSCTSLLELHFVRIAEAGTDGWVRDGYEYTVYHSSPTLLCGSSSNAQWIVPVGTYSSDFCDDLRKNAWPNWLHLRIPFAAFAY
jgi:hypothetical protein